MAGSQSAYDVAAILFAFPLLLALGANRTEATKLDPFWRFSGRLSYPLYVIHEPILRAVHQFGPRSGPAAALAGIAAALAAAWLLTICYDEPLRRHLAARRRPAAGKNLQAT
jgi:peptidoglycan/LPS O-acetylase OafA/YrhL